VPIVSTQTHARRRDGRKLALDNLAGESVQRLRVERVLVRCQFIQNAAEGPRVALEIVRLVLEEFGRHVVWSAW
jgi:hypothetical protein